MYHIWTLFEDSCTEFDLGLTELSHSSIDFGGSNFREALKRKALMLFEIDRQKNYAAVLD